MKTTPVAHAASLAPAQPAQAPQPPQPPDPPLPPTPPDPPTPIPDAPAGVQPTVFQGLIPGMPLSDAQREQLSEIRSSLSDQLISASGRRDEAAAALRTATGADRAGIEARMRLLDERILKLEADIAYTGRLITGVPLTTEGTAVPPPWDFGPPQQPDTTAISIVFTLFVLAPMALAAARLMWKRATGQRPPAPSLESVQRLERVEQAIDSIAVEVERISEGQRFVTRILTEGSAQSVLNAGQRAENLAATRREGIKVPREGQ
jgi:Spy/CpxP family protein refolding chaperone